MAELTCRCLNVTVHLENKEVKLGTAVKPSDLLMNIKRSSTFEQLYEVNLGVAGITVVSVCACIFAHMCIQNIYISRIIFLQAHNSLMQTYESGDWVVHKCANCSVDTHIVHRVKGDSKVFVTNNIEVSLQKYLYLQNSVLPTYVYVMETESNVVAATCKSPCDLIY